MHTQQLLSHMTLSHRHMLINNKAEICNLLNMPSHQICFVDMKFFVTYISFA
jgi:hypothetical protein